MKNVKMLKGLLIIVLSLFVVFTYSNMVFADDSTDGLFEFEPVEEETGTNTSTTEPAANNSADNGLASLSENNASNNVATNNTNIATTNTNTTSIANNNNNNTANTLADTGLSDSGSIVAIVLVICGISAVYSYKKVSDYRKL